MRFPNSIKFIISIMLCLSAGLIGSVFTDLEWYSTIIKPAFTPPSWLFAPVWTILFISMGVSLYFVLKKDKNRYLKIGLFVFAVQLILNAAWSFLFFGLHDVLFALADILLLWSSIALTIYFFWKIDKNAAYLLVPYISWVTFAIFLNLAIYIINAA